MKRTKWLGSDVCDICHTKISTVLYDAKTVYGLGQKYVKNEDGDFIKEEA